MGQSESSSEGSGGATSACTWNASRNTCDDIERAGIARVRTDQVGFERYIPSGWMYTDGVYDSKASAVKYDATPVYENIEWTPCTNRTDCLHRANTTSKALYYTGIRAFHKMPTTMTEAERDMLSSLKPDIPGYDCWGGSACPADRTKYLNRGKAPCPQRTCTFCVRDLCQASHGRTHCRGEGYQLMCAEKINAFGTCPSIGNTSYAVALSSAWDAARKKGVGEKTPGLPVSKHPYFVDKAVNHGHAVCSYGVSSLVTPDMTKRTQFIRDYMALRESGKIPTNEAFHGPLMAAFCSQVRTATPGFNQCKDVIDDPDPTRCSLFRDTGEAGEHCRTWLASLREKDQEKVPVTYDSVIARVCKAHPELGECACYNRRHDPHYVEVINYKAEMAQGNEYCWYKPCRSGLSQGMLLEGSMAAFDAGEKVCNVNFCGNLHSFIDSHENQTSAVQQITTCNLGVSSDGSSGPVLTDGDSSYVPGVGSGSGSGSGGGGTTTVPDSSGGGDGGGIFGSITDLFGSGGSDTGDGGSGAPGGEEGGEGGSSRKTVMILVGVAVVLLVLYGLYRFIKGKRGAGEPEGEKTSKLLQKQARSEVAGEAAATKAAKAATAG